MQLKGIVRFFTIILVVVCVYQLSFTLATKMVERKAEGFALAQCNPAEPTGLNAAQKIDWEDSVAGVRSLIRRAYLDSIQNEPVINLGIIKYSYKDCRDKQLNLGLDLKGGMSLVLEIAEDDVLRNLSDNNPTASFNKAIDAAVKAQKQSEGDFLTLFQNEFEKANPDGKLAAIFSLTNRYQGKLKNTSSNDEVISALRSDMKSSVDNTFKVLKTRIDQFGVAAPNISLQEGSGRIVVELPGVDDPSRVRKLLSQTAQLEFWDTYETQELAQVLNSVYEKSDAIYNRSSEADSTVAADSATTALLTADSATAANDLLAGVDSSNTTAANDSAAKSKNKPSPLTNALRPNVQKSEQGGAMWGSGPIVASALGKDTAKVNQWLAKDEIRALLPRDLKLFWGSKGESDNSFPLYAIRKSNPSAQRSPLGGDAITRSDNGYDNISGSWKVDLTMSTTGAEIWEKMTEAAVNNNVGGQKVNRCIAIALDDRVISCPRVLNKISGGNTQITGIYDQSEAIDLSNVLNSGKLEARTRVIEESVIGPSLGAEAIRTGLLSLIIGVVIVFLYMIAYYSSSGLIANLAMLLNLFFIVGALANFGAALTLPGMAGIVLTLGMAVDANVIINERIREEIRRGKGLRLAVEEGFQHSYSAIIDGNLTTMLVAVVLLFFGYGPVKGFGVVLTIGLLTSMFTAVLVARNLFDFWLDRKWPLSFGNPFTMKLLTGFNFDFIGKRKLFYGISGVVWAICIASMIFYGFDLGVDFKGGRSYVIKFDQDVKVADVQAALAPQLPGNTIVKTYGTPSQVQITTAYLVNESEGSGVDSIIESRILTGISPLFVNKPDFETFRAKNVKSSIKIEASIADDIGRSALWAGLIGLLGVFLYIFVRFRKFEYAAGAVIALVHDPIIVLGIFSLFRKVLPFSVEIDQNVVAAILTLIGYSVNDTVVVFDRIREFLGLYPTRPLIQNVNDSINTTLSRTVNTAATVFFVSVVLFLFGGEAVRAFSFAMMIGVAVGTYSSIFIASPIMVDLLSRKNKA